MKKIFFFLLSICTLTGYAQKNYTIGKSGIITTGEGMEMRAFEGFAGSVTGGTHYSEMLNAYKEKMPEVNVYSMIIPTAVQYYCPEELKPKAPKVDEHAAIEGMYAALRNVTAVNINAIMEKHKNEKIYARTDHHWLPLGAYYAAQEFARIAKVPFKDLSAYDEHVVHNFCGTMPKFSGNNALKKYPEDFFYYTPKDKGYKTIYVSHTPTSTKGVYTLGEPTEGSFYKEFKDGSSSTYSTFMGGDSKTVHVKCFGTNGRKLMIIKDSYGNALPGYLFYSFTDIYVVDYRYFQKNIVEYAREKGITDLLIANNMKFAYGKNCSTGVMKLLTK